MYLPIGLSVPKQYRLVVFSDYLGVYTGSIGADDWQFSEIWAAFVRWISHIYVNVAHALKTAFASAVKWARDTALPAVASWLSDAATIVSHSAKENSHAALLISASIFLGPQIILLPLIILQAVFLLLLGLLGFAANGIVGGSLAARYQSLCYGGNTPASSVFAIFQSIGMKYNVVTLSNWVLAVIRLLSGLVFVYVVVGMVWLW
ncbi:hypothetical protein B0H15DRAFT_958238 [Mycena belliarum]|uniref:Uncharacterized protein n=1 Tax=Mycena belliarum TaxID=1033014 RepID=A0AAD6XHS6_9AGAR|nr:hypothetical protein B0H15DRAFT_958238 [Mycena belliae]